MFKWLLFIALGYALGGVLFSYWIPRVVKKIDICELSDDKNPGTTNAMHFAGTGIGLFCLVCDIAKGFIPVFFAKYSLDTGSLLFALVIIAPVLGHATAPYDRLRGIKGGKAIAVTFGVLLGLLPRSYSVFLLAFFYIFFSIIIKIPSHRKRSIVTFSAYAITSTISAVALTHLYSFALASTVISILVLIKHTHLFNTENVEEAPKKTHT